MPEVKDIITGEVISKQPYTEEGAEDSAAIADSNPSWEVDYNYPSSDASMRNMNTDFDTYMGGGQIHDVSDKLGMYKKGGKVKKEKTTHEEVRDAHATVTGAVLGVTVADALHGKGDVTDVVKTAQDFQDKVSMGNQIGEWTRGTTTSSYDRKKKEVMEGVIEKVSKSYDKKKKSKEKRAVRLKKAEDAVKKRKEKEKKWYPGKYAKKVVRGIKRDIRLRKVMKEEGRKKEHGGKVDGDSPSRKRAHRRRRQIRKPNQGK